MQRHDGCAEHADRQLVLAARLQYTDNLMRPRRSECSHSATHRQRFSRHSAAQPSTAQPSQPYPAHNSSTQPNTAPPTHLLLCVEHSDLYDLVAVRKLRSEAPSWHPSVRQPGRAGAGRWARWVWLGARQQTGSVMEEGCVWGRKDALRARPGSCAPVDSLEGHAAHGEALGAIPIR